VATVLNNLATLYHEQGRYADALPLLRTTAQKGFDRKDVHLAVLSGALATSHISLTDALTEGYEVVQRAASSAASNAISQLSVRFAAGNAELAQLVRKDQDLSAENEMLDKSLIGAASKEPSKRDTAKEQQIRDRLKSIATERGQIRTSLNKRFPDFAALANPTPISVEESQVAASRYEGPQRQIAEGCRLARTFICDHKFTVGREPQNATLDGTPLIGGKVNDRLR
jgi:hypothetical protein